MGSQVHVYETNAPKERLKELEQLTNNEVDNWGTILENENYIFDYVTTNIVPLYSEDYSEIKESYFIGGVI